MGEVYRARDGKLNREVAIKVLPEAFAADKERLGRFRREAQVLAALNHPHIAAIYGLEESGGVEALVLELVEGETVAERLAQGPLPIEEALGIARQIAEALEAAHERAIVHRDLKPANVKLTPDGKVKVLDFGLAKALSGDASLPDVSASPTLTAQATQAGVVIGTAAYMSPEQARGKSVDKRADIWAFGAVLYEMLTGRRCFEGETVSDTLAAVLMREPEWSALPAAVSPRVRELLARCLRRDAKQRLRDIGEARVALEEELAPKTIVASGISSGISALPVGQPTVERTFPGPVRAAATAAGLLIAVAAGWLIGRRSNTAEAPWSEFTQLTDASGVETGPSISPDGTMFAYASAARGSWDIYVQRVGGRTPLLVAGDPGKDEVWPAFSPDGKQIAFSVSGGAGGIFVVGATGESVRRLTDFGSNPAWSPDGRRIVFCSEEVQSAYATSTESELWIVDTAGGAPTKLEVKAASFQPSWSPSGRRIAFWVNINGQRDLATIPAAGGPLVLATSDVAVDWAPVWSPDGKFLYFASDRGGSMGIWRIPVDEASGRALGTPEPAAAGVDVSMDLPHLSADGNTLVFRSKIQSVNPAAIEFDPATEHAGKVKLLQHSTGHLVPTDVSPDGKWIALYNLNERQQDIFVMHSDGTGLTRLTDDPARDWFPRFIADTAAVSFISNKNGSYQGWSIRMDGSNRTQLTALTGPEVDMAVFSPDGKRLAASRNDSSVLIGSAPWPLTGKGGEEIKAVSMGGGLLFPCYWSRDGRYLTGTIGLPSGALKGNGIYDLTTGTARQLSEDSVGYDLAWMPDRARVAYFTNRGKLMIQNISTLARHEVAVSLPLPPDDLGSIASSHDGRTIYYGAQQTEANIWKVERSKAAKR
jgi:Tol biopolymer transport system component